MRRDGRRHGRRGLSPQEARELAGRILRLSSADEARVNLSSGWNGNTRYAVNRITTAGEFESVQASITVRFGRREASVSTNRLDEASLRETVAAAESLARLAPEDPELMPELGPQEYPQVEGYFGATADLGPGPRGEVAAQAIDRARRAGDLEAAGFLSVSAGSSAVANSAGLFAYHASTGASYSLTVRSGDGSGSGWAGEGDRDWSAMHPASVHERAVDKAIRSREPRSLEPGRYAVVFEPEAVSDLVQLLASALSARSADEGRSAFSAPGGTRVGEKILDSRVTLVSDPAGLGSQPFQGDGLPLGRETWIENGVLRQLSYDRFWAQKQGARPTGAPDSLRMRGEDASLEDLIRGTRRGLLVTRLWYIRQVDPRTILYTGLTRDGTFLIEDGEIRYPVNNFRWNDSPLFALDRLEAMSRPVRVSASREVPAIRVSEFEFTSVSEAV